MTTRLPLRRWGGGTSAGVALYLVVAMLATFGCAVDNDDGATEPVLPTAKTDDCVGCHSDKDKLVATADPLPPPPGEGAGEG